MTAFSTELRILRERANQTQAQLALASGLSASMVSRFERGERLPSRRALRALAGGLGLNNSERQLLSLAAHLVPSDTDFVSLLETYVTEQQRQRRRKPFQPNSLVEFAGDAHRLWLAGATLYSLPTRFEPFLEERLWAGCDLSLVITHPAASSGALNILQAIRSVRPDAIQEELELVMDMASRLSRKPTRGVIRLYGTRTTQVLGAVYVKRRSLVAAARLSVYLEGSGLEYDPVMDFSSAATADRPYMAYVIQHIRTLIGRSERLL